MLKCSIAKVLVRRVTFYGDVLPVSFCGVFGKRGIVEFFKITIILLILFRLCFNTQLLGAVRTIPNTFVITTFL